MLIFIAVYIANLFLCSFHPEVLGMTASSGLATLVLEVIVVRLSFLVIRIQPGADIVDFVAVSGYKYVGYANNILCDEFTFRSL